MNEVKTQNGSYLENALAAFLVMATPLLVFTHHHSYRLWTVEAMLLFAWVAVIAAVLGRLMSRGPRLVGPVVLVALITLLVDVQTDWITTIGLRLLLTLMGASLLVWVFRRVLIRAVILVFGLMFMSTFLVPGQPAVLVTKKAQFQDQDRQDLPFILHLVLDEHIGIEGIPREFDPEGELATELKEAYLADSFQVQGRAYSRYYQTFESIANVLNFSADRRQAGYFSGPFREGDALQQNAWFQQLRVMGYRLHVLQSDYLRFPTQPGESSKTVILENIGVLQGLDLPVLEKARFIAGSYCRLSFFLSEIRNAYSAVRNSGPGRFLKLARWEPASNHLSTLTALGFVDTIKQDLLTAGPGQAFFVHLLLPHSPYALDAGCGMRPADQTWPTCEVVQMKPRRNTPVTRNERYPLYLDQLRCTAAQLQELFDVLKERGLWENSIVIVHGDHGSRIDMGPPKNQWVREMGPTDFIDAFSTLFMVKQPGMPGRYLTEQLPIDYLLARTFQAGGTAPPDSLLAHPQVLCYTRGDSLAVWPMPLFADGEPWPPPGDSP